MKGKKKFNINKYALYLLGLILIGGLSFGIGFKIYNIKHSKEVVKVPIEASKEVKEEKKVISDKDINETKKEIIISSVGDCTLGKDDKFAFKNSMPDVLAKNNNDYGYFFKNVADIFKADDITTANLETTFTDAMQKADKQFTFKAPAEYAKAFPLGGIEGVNVANNHIYDYLEKGFKDTLEALKLEKVNYFGEGNEWITEVKGVKIGFLGYRGYSYDNAFLKKLKNDISTLKGKTDFVVINFHWGDENSYNPNNVQKYLAHYSIDSGADLIVGHHPHVVEGFEKYKGKIIAYSLGNFAFGGNMNPTDKDTLILQMKLSFTNNKLTGYGVRTIPCSISTKNNINDYSPIVVTGGEKERILNKLNKLSFNLGFDLKDEFTAVDINIQ